MAVPRTQFYHPARAIDAALHGIDRAIRRAEGIALVVGPPGTGKSLLLAKVAESMAEDFRVALLSGATICTRRALWQSILAELSQPYRGIDEAELRIAVGELVRGLAAAGSGLVILVDEAHTLPLRLIEELRLLANTPTPLPAVHLVLAGPASLEERLGNAKMESFSQRIAVRAYLEPLDHAETVAYLRTQTKSAGIDWDKRFEPGCDDAVYAAADGVPRLMNQICDQSLLLVSDAGRRVKPIDIAAAWREIQRLPSPVVFGHIVEGETSHDAAAVEPADRGDQAEEFPTLGGGCPPEDAAVGVYGGDGGVGVIEYGSLEDAPAGVAPSSGAGGGGAGGPDDMPCAGAHYDPWQGPDVEFVFDASADPFQEFFEQEERIVERYFTRSAEDGRRHPAVSSGEGAAVVRRLVEAEEFRPMASDRDGGQPPLERHGAAVTVAAEVDDDMVVIEEDLLSAATSPAVAAVRLGDYRRLFARLRRGG